MRKLTIILLACIPLLCQGQAGTSLIVDSKFEASVEIPTDYDAYWPFTGNAEDQSGNEIDGTVNGAVLTTDRFGNSNSAYDFTPNQYIQFPDSSQISAMTDFTHSLWVQESPHTVQRSLWYKWGGGGQREYIIRSQGGNINIIMSSDGSAVDVNFTSDSTIDDGSWHHIVVWRSGSDLDLYIDNEKYDIATFGTQLHDGDEPVYLGVDNNQSNGFDGKADDIRHYNRALTAQEIENLFQEGGWPTP